MNRINCQRNGGRICIPDVNGKRTARKGVDIINAAKDPLAVQAAGRGTNAANRMSQSVWAHTSGPPVDARLDGDADPM